MNTKEYNPGGGKDEVLKYLNESKKQVRCPICWNSIYWVAVSILSSYPLILLRWLMQVVIAKSSLEKIMDCLDLKR